MKKTLLIAAFAVLATNSIYAQYQAIEDNPKDNRPTRETYVTNKWFDNIFLGVSGGISTTFGTEISESMVNPTFNISAIKWFSPIMGFRLEAQQTYVSEGLDGYAPYQINHSAFPYKNPDGFYYPNMNVPGTLYYGNLFLNASLMWNLTQFFGYYNPDRIWNLSTYIQGGYSHLFDYKVDEAKHLTKEGKGLFSENFDREYSLGVGLYNTFRITERLHATADIDITAYAANYRTNRGYVTFSPNLTVGLSYNIFKTNWDGTKYDPRAIVVPVDNHNYNELERELANRDKSLKNLQEQLGKTQSELDKTDSELQALRLKAEMQYRAFFDLDKSAITFAERQHISRFIKDTLKKNPNQSFRLTGSADKGTGSFEHNIKLAQERAESVKKHLIKEFGIKEENITLGEPQVTDSQMDASFDRSVLIENM